MVLLERVLRCIGQEPMALGLLRFEPSGVSKSLGRHINSTRARKSESSERDVDPRLNLQRPECRFNEQRLLAFCAVHNIAQALWRSTWCARTLHL